MILASELTDEQKSIVIQGQASFGWSESSTQSDFKRPDSFYIFEGLSGYLGGHLQHDLFEIHSVYVQSNFRGQGVGTKLFERLITVGHRKDITNYLIEVRASNQIAIHLYKNYQFEIIHERKNYYRNPVENAFVMQRIERNE